MKTENFIKRITITFFLFFLFQACFSQENYLSGYIISLNGDTLSGYIDYRNWENNPDNIFFKEKLSDNKSNYGPIDIKGFNVLDEMYKSAIIQTEVSSSENKSDAELKLAIDTTFLQTIIEGEKCLYFYKNKSGKDQFYIKKDTSYEFLVYKKFIKRIEGKTGFVENKKFLGQLSFYFQDCPEIQSKLKNTEYRKKSLENLFLFYFNCTKSEIVFHKKTESISIELGVLTGLSLTSLNFNSDNFTYLVNANYNQSANLSAGLFFDVILPRNQGKWSLNNELIFTSYKVNGRFDDYENENKYTITYTSFGYSYLKVNNMLRFKYPVGSLYIYLNAGISNGFAISESNYRKKESKFYTTERVVEDKALDESRKYEQGYIIGLGTKFKKYSFEIRYENGNGMSEYTSLNSSIIRYYFLLSYRF